VSPNRRARRSKRPPVANVALVAMTVTSG